MTKRKIHFDDHDVSAARANGDLLRSSVPAKEVDGRITRWQGYDKQLAKEVSLVQQLLPYVAGGEWVCADACVADDGVWAILLGHKPSGKQIPFGGAVKFPHLEWRDFLAASREMATHLSAVHQGLVELDIPSAESTSVEEMQHYNRLVAGAQTLAAHRSDRAQGSVTVPAANDGDPMRLKVPAKETVEAPTAENDGEPYSGEEEETKKIKRTFTLKFAQLSCGRNLQLRPDQNMADIVVGAHVTVPVILKSSCLKYELLEELLLCAQRGLAVKNPE